MTQVVGNHYKNTLSEINLLTYPKEIKVILLMTISFFLYIDNVLLNIGVHGFAIFINDYVHKFKNSEIKNESPVIYEYLKQWKEFAKRIMKENKDNLLSPKVARLINTFFDGSDQETMIQSSDSVIIFVDQRLVADLLYRVLREQLPNGDILDVVYSHGNKGVLQKTMKKLKVDSDKVYEVIEEIINLESVHNRSLTAQRKTLENFREGKIRVLIATSVIEEGLDIPQCNQIIVYDKIQTPKTYIQMSGRARMINSKIHFL